MSDQSIFIPNISSFPSKIDVDSSSSVNAQKPKTEVSEFDKVFDNALSLENIREPLKFSAHASQRIKDRKINIDPATLSKVNNAIDKAASKGVEDGLILTENAAFIVSIKNRTIVTAMDRNQMNGNVFTNIDGAIIA